MTDEDLRELIRGLVDEGSAAVRFGFADRETVLERLEDAIVNELDEPEAAGVLAEVSTNIAEVDAAVAAEEATWPARTTTDRLEDALADLAGKGAPVERFASLDRGGGFHERMADDPWEPVGDAARWHLQLVFRSTPEALEAHGAFVHARAAHLRADELEAEAAELVRVLRHHGLGATYEPAERHVRLAIFPWQARRTTPRPPPGPVAPPAPVAAACAACGGRGWVAKSPNEFPSVCPCRNSGLR